MNNSIFLELTINPVNQLLFMLLNMWFNILGGIIDFCLTINSIFLGFWYYLFFENFFVEK